MLNGLSSPRNSPSPSETFVCCWRGCWCFCCVGVVVVLVLLLFLVVVVFVIVVIVNNVGVAVDDVVDGFASD